MEGQDDGKGACTLGSADKRRFCTLNHTAEMIELTHQWISILDQNAIAGHGVLPTNPTGVSIMPQLHRGKGQRARRPDKMITSFVSPKIERVFTSRRLIRPRRRCRIGQ